MPRIWTIACTAWQETIRRQVFFVVLLLAVLICAFVAAQSAFIRMATAAGETATVAQARSSLVQETLGIWGFAATFLAVFLGAVGLSSEISRKTIVHVLSRPVDRSAYLAGRWAGLLLFLWGFLAIGVAIGLILSLAFSVGWTPMASVAVLGMFISVLFYSGVSLGLSVLMPPVLAGCLAFVLSILPGLVGNAVRNPTLLWRILANAGYYVGPAKMPGNLLEESFSRELLHPEYGLYFAVLGENLLYAIAVFTVGCLIFNRRELRLR